MWSLISQSGREREDQSPQRRTVPGAIASSLAKTRQESFLVRDGEDCLKLGRVRTRSVATYVTPTKVFNCAQVLCKEGTCNPGN